MEQQKAQEVEMNGKQIDYRDVLLEPSKEVAEEFARRMLADRDIVAGVAFNNADQLSFSTRELSADNNGHPVYLFLMPWYFHKAPVDMLIAMACCVMNDAVSDEAKRYINEDPDNVSPQYMSLLGYRPLPCPRIESMVKDVEQRLGVSDHAVYIADESNPCLFDDSGLVPAYGFHPLVEDAPDDVLRYIVTLRVLNSVYPLPADDYKRDAEMRGLFTQEETETAEMWIGRNGLSAPYEIKSVRDVPAEI